MSVTGVRAEGASSAGQLISKLSCIFCVCTLFMHPFKSRQDMH